MNNKKDTDLWGFMPHPNGYGNHGVTVNGKTLSLSISGYAESSQSSTDGTQPLYKNINDPDSPIYTGSGTLYTGWYQPEGEALGTHWSNIWVSNGICNNAQTEGNQPGNATGNAGSGDAAKIQQLDDELTKDGNTITSLQSDLTDLKTQFQAQLQAQQTKYNEDLTNQNSQWQSKYDALNQQMQNASTQAGNTIKSDTNEINTDEKVISSIKQSLSQAQETIQSSNQTIAKNNSTIQNLQNQLKNAGQAVQHANTQLDTAKTTINTQQNTLQQDASQINSLENKLNTANQANKILEQTISGSASNPAIPVPPGTTVQPNPNTILSVATFQAYTTNYYLAGKTSSPYYSGATAKRLQSIICNVEINLNAMLNGRLYEKYPPSAVVFKGIGKITPQVEEQTLYQCLTECVEYRLITQQYVNLTNSYSGVVSGSNNYQTENNNVIGLRQDIASKLSLLGLYSITLIGKKVPKSTEYQEEHDGFQSINFANLQQWYGFIQNTGWNFTKPITFAGGMKFSGDVLFTNGVNFKGAISAQSLTTDALNLNGGNISGVGNLDAFTLNLYDDNYSGDVPYFSINYSNSQIPNVKYPLGFNFVGNQNSVFDVTATTMRLDGINALTGISNQISFQSQNPIIFNPGIQVNGDITSTGTATVKGLTVDGPVSFNTTQPVDFSNGIKVTGGNVDLNGSNLNVNNLSAKTIYSANGINLFPNNTTPTSPSVLNYYYGQNGAYQANPGGNLSSPNTPWTFPSVLQNLVPNGESWVLLQTDQALTTQQLTNVANPQVLMPLGNGSFLVEQFVYDLYPMNDEHAIPGYMEPLGDGDAYVDLQQLFLYTFGNGDLSNGYTYTFNTSLESLGICTSAGTYNISPYSIQIVNTSFTVSILSSALNVPSNSPLANFYNSYRYALTNYSCNPFTQGVMVRNIGGTVGGTNNGAFKFTIGVPYAVDNRRADETMFLHGALNLSATTQTGKWLIAIFRVVYVLSLTGFNQNV